MSAFTDETFVKTQYATSANLDARITLHEKYSTATQPFHDWLFDRVYLPSNARILEIGCGSGAMWKYVAPRVPATWNLTLTDYSFGMATQARTNLESLISNLAFAQTDAQSLPFPDHTFDGIFANHMLYHVPDVDRAIAEFRRVLKDGGTLYTATNGEAHLQELRALISSVTHQPERVTERSYSLENGARFLSKHFSSVTVDAQPNNLRVTAVEPLIAYIASGTPFTLNQMPADAIQHLRTRIQEQIDANGAFYITKSVGLFISH